MKNRQECEPISENAVVTFCVDCEVNTPDETRKVMELLISKCARAIEKYCGKEEAINVLRRTICHLQGRTLQ